MATADYEVLFFLATSTADLSPDTVGIIRL